MLKVVPGTFFFRKALLSRLDRSFRKKRLSLPCCSVLGNLNLPVLGNPSSFMGSLEGCRLVTSQTKLPSPTLTTSVSSLSVRPSVRPSQVSRSQFTGRLPNPLRSLVTLPPPAFQNSGVLGLRAAAAVRCY